MIADNQGFPHLSTPIAQPNGWVTQPWLQVFIALWNRTGAGQNVVGQGTYSGRVDTFAGPVDKIPQGWLACDGSAVSRKTYSLLFTAIGTAWGAGDGESTFNLPDMRDRVAIGAGNLYSVGDTGGAASETLTVGNLPPHNHGVTDPQHTHTFTGSPHTHTITDPQHHHSTQTPGSVASIGSGSSFTVAVTGVTGDSATGITINNATAGGTNANSPTGITIQNTGSGDPFSILPPYAAMTHIIKT